MISYRPFFETLKNSGISMYDLTKYYKVAGSTLQKLRENENMNLSTIDCVVGSDVEIVKICRDFISLWNIIECGFCR